MNTQNGGVPKNNSAPSKEPTSWADDHVAITGIFGIDKGKRSSLCGSFGSQFMIDEWGYPEIGVYICDCPSAGHDMVALDYRDCGKNGEPKVVHVDQEFDYKITVLAANFEEFIRGLVADAVFDLELSSDGTYLWKPNDISFELKHDSEFLNFGLMLELNQKLEANDVGWRRSRLNVPENWKDAILKMREGRIQIEVNNKTYYIDKENHGDLSSAILTAGPVLDDELEKIWGKYAV